jgi:CPA2 family monovalent cation:H+ antiporter-2
LLPLRDAFVALFFVTIGVLIDPRTIISNLSLLLTMIGLIVAGKLMIWTTVVRLFGYSLATAFLAGIGLTQIGEFSFVLVQVAKSAGLVGSDVYNATLAASLITILLNAALVRYAPLWIGKRQLARELHDVPSEQEVLREHVVVCGFGRIGSALGKALSTFGIPYIVIERDPDIIRRLRLRGTPCLYGDASHQELLLKAGTAEASLVVVALPEIEPAALAVRRIRIHNPKVPILSRAHGVAEADKLISMGSTEVIQPEVEASATLIRHALNWYGLPKERILDYVERHRNTQQKRA